MGCPKATYKAGPVKIKGKATAINLIPETIFSLSEGI